MNRTTSRFPKRALKRALPAVVAASVVAGAGIAAAATSGSASSGASATTEAVVTAADSFLATLSTSQIATLTYDYSDNTDKYKWSNLPVSAQNPRNGLKLGDLSATQKAAALAVVQAELSAQGYTQEEALRTADDYLAAKAGNGYGSGLYYIAFFGTPSTSSPFFVQFGGHHLAINADYNGDSVSITPEFVGVEPQTFTSGGVTYTPMAGEKSAVAAVLASLSTSQTSASKISGTFSGPVMGPGSEGTSYPSDSGVLVSSLSSAQQALVTAAIEQWVDDFPTAVAQSYLDAYTSAYDQTYVGWGNTTDMTSSSLTYFRISGPRVWIEYINQGGIVYSGLHIHTVFRDKSFDYDAGESTGSTTLSTTTTTLSGASSSTYGTAAKVTATVAGTGATPTGTVTLYDGATALGSGSLSDGAVTLSLPARLAAGSHTISAVYSGDSANDASTSASRTLTVARRSSATALRILDTTVRAGRYPVVRVRVTPSSPPASGKVRILVDGTAAQTFSLSSARTGSWIRVVLPTAKRGWHRVRAVYAGNAGVRGSSSVIRRFRVF